MSSPVQALRSHGLQTSMVSITPTSEFHSSSRGTVRGQPRDKYMSSPKLRTSAQKLPVVKLKEGSDTEKTLRAVSSRKGRSVAEFNNLRSNYENYCHYRRPNSQTKPSSASPSEGIQRKSLEVERSRSSKPNRQATPSASSPPAEMPQRPRLPPQNKTTTGMRDYEVRGKTLNKRTHSARPDMLLKAFLEVNAVDESDRRMPCRDEDRLYMDTGTLMGYCSAHPDDMPDDGHAKPVYDRRSLQMLFDDPNRCYQRRVTFKGDEKNLVTAYTINPESEESIRIGLTQAPLMLTEQNLQIFNRLNHTPAPGSPNPNNDNLSTARAPPTNERVLEWVLERRQKGHGRMYDANILSPRRSEPDAYMTAATCS